MGSVHYFRDLQQLYPDFDDQSMLAQRAPIEVIIQFYEWKHKLIEPSFIDLWDRCDIEKWQNERNGKFMPVKVPYRIRQDLAPEAIDSIYRSFNNEQKQKYVVLIANYARLDALKFIQTKNEKMGRPRLDLVVTDVRSTFTGEKNTIETMKWIREQGCPWRRTLTYVPFSPGPFLPYSQFCRPIFKSLTLVQWLDKNGLEFMPIDWFSVFDQHYPPNTQVVQFLLEKEIYMPTGWETYYVGDEYEYYKLRQEVHWKQQLSSIESLQQATPHDFPVHILLQAPADVIRFKGQQVSLEDLIEYSRYDLLTPEQLANVHDIDLLDEQAKNLDALTLIKISRATHGIRNHRFIKKLMEHGHTDVLNFIAP